MKSAKRLFVIINLLGGLAVLGSYIWGFSSRPDASDLLWGGVPAALRSIYTGNMFLAALGYLAFSLFILLTLNPITAQFFNCYSFNIIFTIYLGILIPSALWLPFTFFAVDNASQMGLWAVRLVLTLVALSSIALLIALLTVKPRKPLWAQRAAVVGAVFFCIQTVLLDAVIWVSYFTLT